MCTNIHIQLCCFLYCVLQTSYSHKRIDIQIFIDWLASVVGSIWLDDMCHDKQEKQQIVYVLMFYLTATVYKSEL